jgi:hypothetical protein
MKESHRKGVCRGRAHPGRIAAAEEVSEPKRTREASFLPTPRNLRDSEAVIPETHETTRFDRQVLPPN